MSSTQYDDLLERLSVISRDAAFSISSNTPTLAENLEELAAEIRTRLEGSSSKATRECNSETCMQTDDTRQQKKRRKEKPTRELDFSKYQQRHVALEVMYIGIRFQGFARQDSTDNTIEGELFKALVKTRLIAPDADISCLQYSRCGRTDKGVSALGQVVALLLRSNGRSGETMGPEEEELEYAHIINSALPPEIRVLGWTTVPHEFNARFSAQYRQYKYFILQRQAGGSGGLKPTCLNIEAMREAARHFVGEHDFRNFCKPDVLAVRSFRRHIMSFDVDPTDVVDSGTGAQVYVLNIRGTAFLWHQVRCMAAVLLMVGQDQEDPDIVASLLDLSAWPQKPQYAMAAEEPLLLYACGFPNLKFRRTERAVGDNKASLESVLERNLVAAAMASSILQRLMSDVTVPVPSNQANHVRTHVPLIQRSREPSVEDRLAKHGLTWPLPGKNTLESGALE